MFGADASDDNNGQRTFQAGGVGNALIFLIFFFQKEE